MGQGVFRSAVRRIGGVVLDFSAWVVQGALALGGLRGFVRGVTVSRLAEFVPVFAIRSLNLQCNISSPDSGSAPTGLSVAGPFVRAH